MSPDDLDRDVARALNEPDLVPSSGFVRGVMTAVYEEAVAGAPEPIPFPWRRLVPALIAGAVAAVAPLALWLATGPAADTPSPPESLQAFADTLAHFGAMQDVQILIGALLLTLAAIELPRRFIGQR